MRALTYEGPYHVKVRDKPDPRVEHPDDVILRVTRAAICGSDLHLYHGFVPDTRVGSTFGHEFTGVVEEIGPGVRSLVRGDRVVVPFNISCGTCFYCQRGLYGDCEASNPMSDLASGVYGYSHMTGGYDGGQAEYVRVPFADVGPMKIPEDMTEEDVLLLSDVLPTGYQAAEMGGITDGDTIAVFGCGPVGLVAARSAWLLGAGRVVAVDRVPERLEFARRWAGAEIVDLGQVKDPIAVLRELNGGRGPDVCIDAVGLEASGSPWQTLLGRKLKLAPGSSVVLDWAIHSVRKGGTISIVGVYGPPANLVPIGAAMNKGLTLRMGQANVKRYMPHLLQHVRAGRLDGKALITHRFPLEHAAHAYQLFEAKADGCVKCVLVPSGAVH
ncbi:zinc-dependent alcohol dehydrogenase [Anaeromyxobacter oryzae]|uniref:Glutathione-dependent formaldehyde dehydrogenase n=1 Tax=Anaeromyxobacter oryzae TaxID=2918170 RepID=A0ABM7X358_9BACT|nr:zinc-dependent alcohol dehydrogenase [Anaeromyxobacter oryzae]BDG06235.1 glutathione-dependent formaldehyde dehydrogenase [Anaeromyxobacter oryzae]